jgi:hypothetical protein
VQYLALNGFRHSLFRYFNSTVTCVEQFNWTERNALELSDTITQPTTLIGFSDGATACLTINSVNKNIVKVYAHSPMFNSAFIWNPNSDVTLFRTLKDRTPTFEQTLLTYYHLANSPGVVQMHDLRAVPHEPVRNLATFIMKIKNHQFRNCLPYLPQEIIRNES